MPDIVHFQVVHSPHPCTRCKNPTCTFMHAPSTITSKRPPSTVNVRPLKRSRFAFYVPALSLSLLLVTLVFSFWSLGRPGQFALPSCSRCRCVFRRCHCHHHRHRYRCRCRYYGTLSLPPTTPIYSHTHESRVRSSMTDTSAGGVGNAKCITCNTKLFAQYCPYDDAPRKMYAYEYTM